MPLVNWSFDLKLLNTYYALGTVLGAGGTRIPEQTQPLAGKRDTEPKAAQMIMR